MTRIVAGIHRGRRLAVPEGRDTRPTSDRVREALFSALESRTDVAGARFVDLYAGSGAVGLEAHSRGAEQVLLVESAAKAARVIRDNIATLQAGGAVRLLVSTVEAMLRTPPQPFDIVFLDPPYAVADAEVAALLTGLVEHDWLAGDAVVVVERGKRSRQPSWPSALVGEEKPKKYGEAILWFSRHVTEIPESQE